MAQLEIDTISLTIYTVFRVIQSWAVHSGPAENSYSPVPPIASCYELYHHIYTRFIHRTRSRFSRRLLRC